MLVLLLTFRVPAASSVRIGASPFLPPAMQQQFQEELLTYVLQTAQPPLTVSLHDGWTGSEVCRMEIPVLVSESKSGRLRKLRPELARLARWPDAGSYPAELAGSARLNIVTTLERLSEGAGAGAAVVLVGSPVHVSDEERGFSFVDLDEADPNRRYRLPTHGHLRAPGDVSPFTTVGKETRLAGVTVHWWVPGGGARQGSAYFQEQVKEWWGSYVALQGGGLARAGREGRELFAALMQSVEVLPAAINPLQNQVGMLSRVRAGGDHLVITNHATVVDLGTFVTLPPVTDVLLVDQTGSMGDDFADVAREIAVMPRSKHHRYLMVLFSDHGPEGAAAAFVFSEDSDPSEMIKAARNIPLVNGHSIPECLQDGLHLVAKELKQRKTRNARIRIWTDAPPNEAKDCPHGHDAVRELNALLADGHEITFVKCDPQLDAGWLPKGVTVASLKKD